MAYGYCGKIALVDLSRGKIEVETLDERIARDFVGGYGLGVRTLFERQKSGIDPLGPENILGFTTGPLTGAQIPGGGRYTVVGKSPLTGGWGDANSGGYFGNELKMAGWDAVFIAGKASSPCYLLVTDTGIEVRDAAGLWGMDTVDTEDQLRRELGVPGIKVACIGPASEKLSLISGIVNDKGRIAARSGLGAVMGSKLLKAVAVYGKKSVDVADRARLNELRRSYNKQLRESPVAMAATIMKYGTSGTVESNTVTGAAPVKNWLYAGGQAFPDAGKLSDDEVINFQSKKFACTSCSIACGGIVSVPEGPYPFPDSHKPEYETMAAFGPLVLNDDLLSVMKLNDMCNRSGLDTISAGTTLAFAMECFERGIITQSDTDGIELTWGNAPAMITMVEKMIAREGFGDVLADGVRIAAQKIGKGAEQFAMHIGGQEPGMHNALILPGRGTGYIVDATPGRHTAAGATARLDVNAKLAPYPEMQFSGFERYEYKRKGPAGAAASCYWQVGTCAGLCLFPVIFFGDFPMLDVLNAVTGWGIGMEEALKTGARIQTLRWSFNIREGINPSSVRLPERMIGVPPKSEGPLAGVTIDIDSLVYEHRKAMGWDPDTGYPTEATLERLGLQTLVQSHA